MLLLLEYACHPLRCMGLMNRMNPTANGSPASTTHARRASMRSMKITMNTRLNICRNRLMSPLDRMLATELT